MDDIYLEAHNAFLSAQTQPGVLKRGVHCLLHSYLLLSIVVNTGQYSMISVSMANS